MIAVIIVEQSTELIDFNCTGILINGDPENLRAIGHTDDVISIHGKNNGITAFCVNKTTGSRGKGQGVNG